MSQAEILEFLREYANTWFRSKEIAEKIGIGRHQTNKNLNQLRKTGFVQIKPIEDNHGFVYKYEPKPHIPKFREVISCQNCGHMMLHR